MTKRIFYIAQTVPAMEYARKAIAASGISVADTPGPDITHLLLPVPSFQSGGLLRGDGDLRELLAMLPENVTVLGGNLNQPVLSSYSTIDLLQDPLYLAENAAITAHCAIKLAMQHMNLVFDACPALVIGWGRIGKCLAALLQALRSEVTVAARKETDRAMAQALGYQVCATSNLKGNYRIVFNTAPLIPITSAQSDAWGADCLKVELASTLSLPGEDVLWARGLPGVLAPESSGNLIAQTATRLTGGSL